MSKMLKSAVVGAFAVAMASVVGAQDQSADTNAAKGKAISPEKAAVHIVKSIFHKADASKDGKLTPAEHQARVKDWFKEMDANGDGKVAPDEFIARRFVSIDVDKDGVVTMEEYLVFFVGAEAAAGQTAACDKLDANGDGEVSLVEMVAYRKSVFVGMDADSDGKLTSDEIKAGADKQFKGLDANNDGFVTVEEMIAVIPVQAAAPKVEEKKADQPAK